MTSESIVDTRVAKIVREFGIRFGLGHLYFAYHAAFPLSFSTSFLYLLRKNFGSNEKGWSLDWPLEVVADFVHSPLCEQLGHDHYRVHARFRSYMLGVIQGNPWFGKARMDRLGEFVSAYYSQPMFTYTQSDRRMAETQILGALILLEPEKAAVSITETLKASSSSVLNFAVYKLNHALQQYGSLPTSLENIRNLLGTAIHRIEATSEVDPSDGKVTEGNVLNGLVLELSQIFSDRKDGDVVLSRIRSAKSTRSKSLDLTNCGIADDLPDELRELIWLEELDLSGNVLAAKEGFPNPLAKLSDISGLRTLNLRGSAISDISPLRQLNQLQELDLRETLVADLEPINGLIGRGVEVISGLGIDHVGIKVFGCPLKNPPYEVAKQGNRAILRYWDRRDNGTQPLNEAKIILLGQGAAGKTSLVKRLFKERFKKTESQTNGIHIRKQNQMLGDEYVTLRYWDFGGQEIMHATHRFFLSQRSLYVVVLDARKDEGDVDYWLDHVKTYGGKSRVIVVVNKIDENPGFQLDERGLQNKYGDRIQGFHRISCKSGEGIKELQKHIHALVAADELTQLPLPKPWRELKEKVEAIETDFISYERFGERCNEQSIDEPSEQDILLRLLNDLGVMLYVESLRRYNTAVLNPEWLTLAVYRVLNSRRIADQGGEFEAEDLDQYLNDPKYRDKLNPKRFPREKYAFIAEVMEAFQLCFRLPARYLGRTRYLIPELLPKQEPELEALKEHAVQMEVRYPGLLPPSILPRFIVAMHPWVVAGKAWRTGVLLLHGDWETQALVKLDRQDRRISIAVEGKQARRMMGFVRDTLGKLHSEFADLAVEEWVPLEGGRDFVKYATLVGLEKMGETHYIAAELLKKFPIADLLDGVATKELRQEHRPDPVRIFISYAHKNLQSDGAIHKENLLTHLSSYTRSGEVIVWDDGCIVAGHEWEKEILTQHRQADIVLCLVNANFIASEYCQKREFLEADNGRRRGEKDVVPILVEPCFYDVVPAFSSLQFANTKPVAMYTNANTGWAEVMRKLEPVIERWKLIKAEEHESQNRIPNEPSQTRANQLIDQARKERWRSLDLGNCGITGKLPDEIGELEWLEELNLGDRWFDTKNDKWIEHNSSNRGEPNRRATLPDSFSNLRSLKTLNCQFLPLSNPDILSELTSLEVLRLGNSELITLPRLDKLKDLKQLDIYGNEDLSSLAGISECRQLTHLNARFTSISDLSPIQSCSALQKLDVQKTQVKDIRPLRRLHQLRLLNLFGTEVTDLRPLATLASLEILRLDQTNISDISPLGALLNLEELNIGNTTVEDIYPLRSLLKLKYLNLLESRVRDIYPLRKLMQGGLPIIRNFDKDTTGIAFDFTTATNPPIEIAEKGTAAIVKYWQEQDRVGTLPATDIKLFLLGNTTAGKSTLRHALIHQEFSEGVTSTHGAELHSVWKNGESTIHLWDFGGEEYFHGTNRLFLNSNSLYAVIVDPKFNQNGYHKTLIKRFGETEQGEEEVEHFHHDYWLDMVEQLAPQGQVMVVWNKMDQSEMPRPILSDSDKAKFSARANVKEYEQSPKAALQGKNSHWKEQFEIFRHDLLEAARAQLKKQLILKYWPQVREAIEERSKTDLWITWDEFVRICRDDDPLRELGNIVIYLRDMCGAILYWDENGLRDQVFINPYKINQLIYAVLDRTVQQAQGRFTRAHAEEQVAKALIQLQTADAQAQDIPTTTATLLHVMRQFEIIFEVAEGAGEYLAPQCLSHEKPDMVKVAKEHVRYLPAFTLRFKSYIPRHIIPRFIVSKGLLSKWGHYWKMGIIFRENEVSACVAVDYERNEISVEMQDAAAHPAHQRAILDSLRRLADMDDALELAPEGKAFVPLSALIDGLHSGASRVRDCEGNWVDIAPYSYLITARSGHSSSHLPPDHQRDSMKRIYISYASSDKDKVYLAELNECLKLQKKRGRFDGWDRGQMNPGDIKQNRMTAELAKADIFMPLISSSYFADEGEATWELDEAMKLAEAGKLQIVPVVVRAVFGWQDLPIGKYTPALEAKPIGQMPDKDDAWQEVMAWIDQSLHLERPENSTAPSPPNNEKDSPLIAEIRELKQMIAELQSQNQSGHLETQRLLQDSSALLLNKISGVKEFQGTVFEYLRAMEDRLKRGADLKHEELQILLSCIEDGLTLVMEEMDESQKEQLKALSPKSSGGGILDILKLKVALIPMALAILSGDYEKAAELLSEAVLLDATVSNGKKMLVEAWGRAQRLLSTTG